LVDTTGNCPEGQTPRFLGPTGTPLCVSAEQAQWMDAGHGASAAATVLLAAPEIAAAIVAAARWLGLAGAKQAGVRAAPQVGRTVLGHYPAYVEKAAELGARRFNVPANIWNKMSPAQQWAANQKFLDRMIARGDQVILATQANAARAGSFFARELQYLKSQGYQLADDGLSMF